MLTVKSRIGRRRVLVIPKRIAERLNLKEGTAVKITGFTVDRPS